MSLERNTRGKPKQSKDPKLKAIEKTLSSPTILPGVEHIDTLDIFGTRLNYRQKVFVIHYTRHFNGAQAAREAGYAPDHAAIRANELLNNPGVQEAILKRTQALAMASAITKEYVLVELAEIIEELRMCDTPDRNIQLRALDMISKLSGFYQPDLMVNIQNNVDKINIQIIKPGEDESLFPSRIN